MAPEQFRGQAFPATDLYSLGATLLFLLTHRSPAELPQNALKLDFKSQVNVSEAFVEWLEKFLEPDAEDRFSSAKQALSTLSNEQSFFIKKKFISSAKKLKSRAIIGFCLAIPIVSGIYFNIHKHELLMHTNIYRSQLCSNPKLIKKYLKQDRDLNITLEINGKPQSFLDCLVGQTEPKIIELLQAKESEIKDKKKYDKILIFYHIHHNNKSQVDNLTRKQDNIYIKYSKDTKYEIGLDFLLYFHCH
jgi:serine/threonine protein kinase